MGVPIVSLQEFSVILQKSLSLDLAFTETMPYLNFSITNLNHMSLKPVQFVQSLNTSLHIPVIGTKSCH